MTTKAGRRRSSPPSRCTRTAPPRRPGISAPASSPRSICPAWHGRPAPTGSRCPTPGNCSRCSRTRSPSCAAAAPPSSACTCPQSDRQRAHASTNGPHLAQNRTSVTLAPVQRPERNATQRSTAASWVDVPLVLLLPAQRHIDPVACPTAACRDRTGIRSGSNCEPADLRSAKLRSHPPHLALSHQPNLTQPTHKLHRTTYDAAYVARVLPEVRRARHE